MNKSARVIITFDCNRNCPYCCNNYDSILDQAMFQNDLNFIRQQNLDEIAITGGEPLLYPDYLIDLLNRIRDIDPDITIYLYSALYTDKLMEIIKLIDGLHFTLHKGTNNKDIKGFLAVQNVARMYKDSNKTFRLFVHREVNKNIVIKPSLWHRVEVKGWLPEGECPLPEDQLIILEEGK